FWFFFVTSVSVTYRSMPIASPKARTRRIGYMNTPPDTKKPTIEYMVSITLSSLSQCLPVRRDASGAFRLARAPVWLPRAQAVVVELPQEHVPVHRAGAIVQRVRKIQVGAELRGLPRHDPQRFRRFLV